MIVFRLFMVVLVASIVTSSAVSQAGLPALIVEGSGSYAITTKSGEEIQAAAGASLKQGSTLTLEPGSRVLVLLKDQFTIYDTPGEYRLQDVNEEDDLFSLNFDPIFAEYVKASMAAVDRHIGAGVWPVSLSADDGDGWGSSGAGSDKGWGKSDVGAVKGWGASGVGSDKGWGASGAGSDKGWGSSGAGSDKGWGKSESVIDWGGGTAGSDKGKPGLFGWGKSKGSSDKGWGISNRFEPQSGWAAMYRVTSSGWGASGAGSDKGWGKSDPTSSKGWGKGKLGSDKGWGSSGVGSDKGWGKGKLGSDKGWGKEDMTIGLGQPGGYYAPSTVELSWTEVKKSDRYLLVVYDLTNTVLYQAISETNNITVPFGELPKDVSLYYQIYAEGREAISPPTFFKVMAVEDYSDSQAQYINSEVYETSAPFVQDLMRAVSYEHDERYMDCIRLYQSMIVMYPENKLVKFCYAGFLNRVGLDASVSDVLAD